MDRRDFTKLLALAPLAFLFKPAPKPRYELACQDCGEHIGWVEWPTRVDKEGTTLCVAHAVRHPRHEPGKSLITEYHFGIYEDGWAEYQRQNLIVNPREIAQDVIDRLRETDPDVVETLKKAKLA